MKNFKNPADLQATLHEIVRTAVEYGYLRGYGHALQSARSEKAEAPGTDGQAGDRRPQLAKQAAEEFLIKIAVEQVTG